MVLMPIFFGLAATFTFLYSLKRGTFQNYSIEKNNRGNYVVNHRFRNGIVTIFTFAGGLASLCYAINQSEGADSLSFYLLSSFAFVLCAFFLLYTVRERIEYNDNEIIQYIMRTNLPRIIPWNGVREVKFHKVGPVVELRSTLGKVTIDLNCDGAIALLVFMQARLTGQNKAIIDQILSQDC